MDLEGFGISVPTVIFSEICFFLCIKHIVLINLEKNYKKKKIINLVLKCINNIQNLILKYFH